MDVRYCGICKMRAKKERRIAMYGLLREREKESEREREIDRDY